MRRDGPLDVIGSAVATVGRAVWITLVAAICVVAYTAGSLRRLTIRDPMVRAEDRSHWRGVLLRWSFARLGAIFVKVGQLASSRPDVFSPGVIAELRSLQDHVPPFGFRHVRTTIERALGRPLAELFSEIDPVPLAAGGIAQVHRAVLASGDEVAVKVLRPGIRARVRRDGRLLLWLAHVVHVLSARARAADAIGHARTLVAAIVAQAELAHEARNYARFREVFADSHEIAFPRVYEEYSTHDVLVMELVRGVPINQIRPGQVAGVTPALRDAFLAMVFEHGLVHADLHPGNIFVREDGVVVLLDVGLVKYLSDAVIEQIVDLARWLVIGGPAPAGWEDARADFEAFMARLRARSIREIEVAAVVGELFALARKHHIRPITELSLVLLGMVTIEGIAKRLDPDANTIVEVARYLGPRINQGRRLARGTLDRIEPPASVRREG